MLQKLKEAYSHLEELQDEIQKRDQKILTLEASADSNQNNAAQNAALESLRAELEESQVLYL